jgi:hypothetical protein
MKTLLAMLLLPAITFIAKHSTIHCSAQTRNAMHGLCTYLGLHQLLDVDNAFASFAFAAPLLAVVITIVTINCR